MKWEYKEYVIVLKCLLTDSCISNSVKIEHFFVCLLEKKILLEKGFLGYSYAGFLICVFSWSLSEDR